MNKINPHEENPLKSILRNLKETKNPLFGFLLKKVGLATHKISILAKDDQLFKTEVKSIGLNYTEFNRWRCEIKPNKLNIVNTGDTSLHIRKILLFSNFDNNERVKFTHNDSKNLNTLVIDYSMSENLLILPKQSNKLITFSDYAVIIPKAKWLQAKLEFYEINKPSKEELIGFLIHLQSIAIAKSKSDNNLNSDKIFKDLIKRHKNTNPLISFYPLYSAYQKFLTCIQQLDICIVIVLSDNTLLTFKWEHSSDSSSELLHSYGEFKPIFFTAALVNK